MTSLVCTSPRCRCTQGTDTFSCGCIGTSAKPRRTHCLVCGVRLVTVAEYERRAARRKPSTHSATALRALEAVLDAIHFRDRLARAWKDDLDVRQTKALEEVLAKQTAIAHRRMRDLTRRLWYRRPLVQE